MSFFVVSKKTMQMLRKLLHIIMSLILLVSISGFSVYKHYCQNELVAVSVFPDADHCNQDSCDDCADTTMSCRLDLDLLTTDVQNIPEKLQSETDFPGLFPTGLVIADDPVLSLQVSENLVVHSTTHGIPMFQTFRC